MSVAEAVAPEATPVAPVTNERAMWALQANKQINLIVVANGALYAETLSKRKAQAAIDALSGGSRVDSVMGARTKRFMLANIVELEHADDKDDKITVTHRVGDETDAYSLFVEESGEEVLAVLKRAMGATTTKSEKLGALRSFTPSIASGVITAFLTWMATLDFEGARATGRNAGLKRLLVKVTEFLGPTGVLIIGALITLVIALGAKMDPPHHHTVSRATDAAVGTANDDEDATDTSAPGGTAVVAAQPDAEPRTPKLSLAAALAALQESDAETVPTATGTPVTPEALPAAAWFPAPDGNGLRWWDGTQWTEHRHP